MLKPDSTERLITGVKKDGQHSYAPSLTSVAQTEPVRLKPDDRPVIPILFIPGIMGSRLRSTRESGMAWDPPHPDKIGELLATFWEYLFKSAKSRRETLNPDAVEVDYALSPKSLPGKMQADAAALEFRGWGTVYGYGYHNIMQDLQRQLNMSAGLPVSDDIFCNPVELGETSGASPVTEQECKKVMAYRYEVWGGGYNWLQNNEKSADELWNFVSEIILPHYEGSLNKARKIIIVTHSMGGLVARSFCKKHESAVFGVVHIAQPASGAPTTYKRIRAGFEGVERVVLGRDAKDVTGIMGGSQGALELLPFANYDKGQPWLYYPAAINKENPASCSLPGSKGPYVDIYQCGKWYGLIPDENLQFLGQDVPDFLSTAGARAEFNEMINAVKTFHNSIINVYHPHTYAIWGEDAAMKAWGSITWIHKTNWDERNRDKPISEFGKKPEAYPIKDDRRGKVEQGEYFAEILRPEMAGDATVPATSARDQEANGRLKACFIQGSENPAMKSNPLNKKGYEHAACCNDRRVQLSAVYSVAKIVATTT